jgi:hypothetical protein
VCEQSAREVDWRPLQQHHELPLRDLGDAPPHDLLQVASAVPHALLSLGADLPRVCEEALGSLAADLRV